MRCILYARDIRFIISCGKEVYLSEAEEFPRFHQSTALFKEYNGSYING